ncbi:MAG: acetyl-CoA carboxylase, carboxyltransferase subunit beta [Geminicoccaceae bacterium]
MNWLTHYMRPRIRGFMRPRADVPDNLWQQCPGCERMLFHRDLAANLHVCHQCGHHLRVGPSFRFEQLFDDGSWHRIDLPEVPVDPLRFRDRKRYTDRLKEAQAQTQRKDALDVAHGTIKGRPTVMAVMDFAFMAGSMWTGLGEAFVTAAKLAVLQQAAFVVITASGGARMQEGALSLMQMARTTVAVREVKDAGLPYIVVLTDPTTGGVTASFAMIGDVTLAEPGALIGFAGQRVIEETIRQQLPAGFQRAEYLHEHGMVDAVVHRRDLREQLGRVIDLLTVPEVADANQTAPQALANGETDPFTLELAASQSETAQEDAGDGKSE